MKASFRRRGVAARRRGSSCSIFEASRNAIEPLEVRQLLSGVLASTTAELITDINNANSAGGSSRIVLSPGGTYDFTAANNDWYGPDALPAITSGLEIDGN